MSSEKAIDIQENDLLNIDCSLLEILLQDKTTGKNIIWATDNYIKHGSAYAPDKPIAIELIASRNGSIIKPRTQKSKQEQQQRVRKKAEVFTPSWICNVQNNLADEAWFGRKDVFNTEKEKSWETIYEKIQFSDEKGKSWQDYVSSARIEITCGEAPYLTSRYDAVTGEYIGVPDRIGLLDRKLRVVGENTETREDWIAWATVAAQSIYGFEWQGDNLLIARENVLFTIAEHYEARFGKQSDSLCHSERSEESHSSVILNGCEESTDISLSLNMTAEQLIPFAEIISWNIWQMDGLKFVVPNSCCTETKTEETLFETIVISKECEGCKKGDCKKHNGIYCMVIDWNTNQKLRFVDMLGGNVK